MVMVWNEMKMRRLVEFAAVGGRNHWFVVGRLVGYIPDFDGLEYVYRFRRVRFPLALHSQPPRRS
jgi:hypothetical protein